MARVPVWRRQEAAVQNTSRKILSWSDVGWYVALLIGIWGALMGTGDYRSANLFLFLTAMLFVLKLGHATRINQPDRRVLKFVGGVLFAVAAVGGAVYWSLLKTATAKAEAEQRAAEQNEIKELKSILSKKAYLLFLFDPVHVSPDGIATVSFAVQNPTTVPSGRGFFTVTLPPGSAFIETPTSFQNLSGARDNLERSSYFDYIGALIHTAPIKMRIKANAGAGVSFFYSCENCPPTSVDRSSWTTLVIPGRAFR